MAVPLFFVDAFTDQPFHGNPAAVCLLDEPYPDCWMQAVASEMGCSETAFLLRQQKCWWLRWFTPKLEIELCGHATLASAHVLWEQRLLAPEEPALFETRSGRLTCVRRGDWIEMNFPAEPATEHGDPGDLLAALGIEGVIIGRKRKCPDYLVEAAEESIVRTMAPDMTRLAALPVRLVTVTAAADHEGFDFVSRVFGPAVGIPEDPVTGAAHCCLGPFWAATLGRHELVGYQASARGGVVRVNLWQDRVLLGGQAVTIIRGELVASSPRGS